MLSSAARRVRSWNPFPTLGLLGSGQGGWVAHRQVEQVFKNVKVWQGFSNLDRTLKLFHHWSRIRLTKKKFNRRHWPKRWYNFDQNNLLVSSLYQYFIINFQTFWSKSLVETFLCLHNSGTTAEENNLTRLRMMTMPMAACSVTAVTWQLRTAQSIVDQHANLSNFSIIVHQKYGVKYWWSHVNILLVLYDSSTHIIK